MSYSIQFNSIIVGEVIITRTSYEMYENTVKSPKFISSFTFSEDIKWTGLSLLGHFCSPGLMFDSPALDNVPNS